MVSNKIDTSSPSSLRRTHRGLVMALIQAEPGISRAEIARHLGFSEMAATRIIRELLSAGIVEEMPEPTESSPQSSKRLGRPSIGLQIRGIGFFAAGITVSAYHSEVSICDANGELLARKQVAFHVDADIARTAHHYGNELANLIGGSDIDPERIVGVGVALAARTSLRNGNIVKADYFGWGPDDGAFCREVSRATGLPVELDNISNALAIGEMRFGAARSLTDFVLVHVATLIGAAVMAGGDLVRGKDGISGMIGHFRTAPVAQTCVCGRDDCLNLTATGFALLARLGKLEGQRFDNGQLEKYAASLLEAVESPETHDLIAETGAKLAPALDGVCKLLGPEKVIVSGYLGANPHYISGLSNEINRLWGDRWPSGLEITPGHISPTRAAALLALSSFGYSDRLDFDRFLSGSTPPAIARRT